MANKEDKAIVAAVTDVRKLVGVLESALALHGFSVPEDERLTVTLAALNLVYDGRARTAGDDVDSAVMAANRLAGAVSHASRIVMRDRDPGTVEPVVVPGVLRA